MAIANLSATRNAPGPVCDVCRALDSIPPKEAVALRGHLSNPEWRYTELSDALAADTDTPLNLSALSLSRHARGRCAAGEKLRGR